jgi:hypothetical protein
MKKLEFSTIFPGGVISEQAFKASLFPCLPLGMQVRDNNGGIYIYGYAIPHEVKRRYSGVPGTINNVFKFTPFLTPGTSAAEYMKRGGANGLLVIPICDILNKDELQLASNNNSVEYILFKVLGSQREAHSIQATNYTTTLMPIANYDSSTYYVWYNSTKEATQSDNVLVQGTINIKATDPTGNPTTLGIDTQYYGKVDIYNKNMLTLAPYYYKGNIFTQYVPSLFDSGFAPFVLAETVILNGTEKTVWIKFQEEI